jgi:hypothetical protein
LPTRSTRTDRSRSTSRSELGPCGCHHSRERRGASVPAPPAPPGRSFAVARGRPGTGWSPPHGDHYCATHRHAADRRLRRRDHAADRRQRHCPVPGAPAAVRGPCPVRVPPHRLPRGPRRPRRRDARAGLEALRRAGPAREEDRAVRHDAGPAVQPGRESRPTSGRVRDRQGRALPSRASAARVRRRSAAGPRPGVRPAPAAR